MRYQSKPNSWVYQDADPTTTLSYALQIDPAPFTVSIPGENPVTGSLEFVITNGTSATVTVTSVAFTLTVGSDSNCITATTAGISTSVNDSDNWNVIGPSSPVTNDPATYTLEPSSGQPYDLPAGASVVVQIFGFQTITIPGNSAINIKEITSANVGFNSFTVTTFPTGFYFKNLAATVQSGSNLVPIAQVNAGSSVTLTWKSSVVDTTSFAIYYSNAESGQQTALPSDVGEWASPALTSDTVFTVVVSISAEGGQPLSATMSTAVSVQNPSLVATGITAGTATVTGTASISGVLTANAINSTGITVNGSLSSGSATVSGAVSAGSATVSGTVSADSVAVTNGLTAASANVSGTVTTGGASVSGTVSAATVSTNALTVNNIINSGGGANMTGILSLCAAPDYSKGTVGIGGNVSTNSMLTVTNTQSTGAALYINAPYLQNGVGWGLNVVSSCINQNGMWSKFTDVALKKNIKPYKDGLEQILKLNPTTFQYKEDTGMVLDEEHVGIHGHELQEVAPYMVGKGKINPDHHEEYLYTNNGAMIYMLINAVKELKAELDALKKGKKK